MVVRSVCEATTTQPTWFFGKLVCVSLADVGREPARPVQPQRQGGCRSWKGGP